jgi:carbonic anhydrase/acetyltransferase-like protein (isoleucine patch superfamily)
VRFELEGKRPRIHPDARVAHSAVLRGDVSVGAGCVILDGAVLSAESGPIILGRDCVIMEHAVLRGTVGHACTLGDGILVGPHAHLTGCTIEDEVFVATGASIFNGARLGRGSEVRIGATVHVNSHLAAGTMLPIGWIAVGNPAQSFAPQEHATLWPIQKAMGFSETVWGARQKRPQGEHIRRYARRLRARLRQEKPIEDGGDPEVDREVNRE